MAADASHPDPITVAAPAGSPDPVVLTPPVRALVAGLERRFGARRRDLLARRHERQAAMDAGALPDFDPATAELRSSDWQVATLPDLLLDRRVEITGPVDRKMVINALNCGAKCFMADFEDANSPTWANCVEGQINLRDRWAGRIDFTDAASGKRYALKADPAVLLVRPRGWHLPEAHLEVDGQPVSGGLFDFGLYFFHNARAQIAKHMILPINATESLHKPHRRQSRQCAEIGQVGQWVSQRRKLPIEERTGLLRFRLENQVVEAIVAMNQAALPVVRRHTLGEPLHQ